MNEANLAAVLDALLPGGEGFPSASDIGLAAWLVTRIDAVGAVEAVLAALPADIAAEGAPEVTRHLKAFEAAEPAMFGRLLVGAYSGYYVHPRVVAAISATTGYPGPPQPDGRRLAPFDPSVLDAMRGRPPGYREV